MAKVPKIKIEIDNEKYDNITHLITYFNNTKNAAQRTSILYGMSTEQALEEVVNMLRNVLPDLFINLCREETSAENQDIFIRLTTLNNKICEDIHDILLYETLLLYCKKYAPLVKKKFSSRNLKFLLQNLDIYLPRVDSIDFEEFAKQLQQMIEDGGGKIDE